ncbi:hypothetical protein PI124_g19270 [Phytophthora idaei]|nr:hypothetical protein PI125_g20311 [Phytophthora idaei]KAG3135270.1 hypothetical protein PI126_g18314 [Phytophthora idaei]KAG3235700.1 hypothetical protein PI124_g19270 [Phytophthora idaei]
MRRDTDGAVTSAARPFAMQEGQHEDRRASGSIPQYDEHYPRYPQVVQDRRVQTEERERWQEAAMAQQLGCLARRMDWLERENQELRRRRRVVGDSRWVVAT